MICRIFQAQRKSAPSAKDAFCNASSVRDRMGGFLQYCGRALRARSLRFLVPQIEALKVRRHLAKASISFAGTGAKTCGLNALRTTLIYCAYCARTKPSSRRNSQFTLPLRTAQRQNQALAGGFPLLLLKEERFPLRGFLRGFIL